MADLGDAPVVECLRVELSLISICSLKRRNPRDVTHDDVARRYVVSEKLPRAGNVAVVDLHAERVEEPCQDIDLFMVPWVNDQESVLVDTGRGPAGPDGQSIVAHTEQDAKRPLDVTLLAFAETA